MIDPMAVMTVADVADYLRVSESAVRKLIARGGIPSFNVDGQPRVQYGALVGWFQAEAHVRSLEILRQEIQKPSTWRRALDGQPELRDQILAEEHPDGTFGAFLKEAALATDESPSDDEPENSAEQSMSPDASRKDLIEDLEAQKSLMVAVSTGGPRIKDVNGQYEERRLRIRESLIAMDIEDPNPHADLWAWYGKWSDGSLPTYQSRRRYITDLYQPLLDALHTTKTTVIKPHEPTGWTRVDRSMEKIGKALELARNEEDFQSVALLCREAVISLAQAVYDPEKHGTLDGVAPSPTDAKRMLESYIAQELQGQSHEYLRKFARAVFDLAVNLQHRRTAKFRDAALCAEATRSIINTIALLSGQRDPER